MTNEYDIDPMTWYGKRELTFCPKHFIVSNTPLTEEARQWIISKLSGRYCVLPTNQIDNDIYLLDLNHIGNVAFEDGKEAVLYELTWS